MHLSIHFIDHSLPEPLGWSSLLDLGYWCPMGTSGQVRISLKRTWGLLSRPKILIFGQVMGQKQIWLPWPVFGIVFFATTPPFVGQFQKERYPGSASRTSTRLVLDIFKKFDFFGPMIGTKGTRSRSYRSCFSGRLLLQNQAEPSPYISTGQVALHLKTNSI